MLNEAQLAAGFGIAVGLPLAVLIATVLWPHPKQDEARDRPNTQPADARAEFDRSLY
ncbi:hypothetical protein [Nocardia neocaledoniensis]|uniref:hypothetical protein n=1 Tax=Nocardia neocaledoniensis TaxID=236511 RepID=UPI00245401F8|nr:hypothetical protein [Nocardia neocaledoniensis]